MITNEALRWAMAALLLAAAGYATLRAARQPAPAGRVDYGLHALMMIAMVNMLAPGSRWPVLPQVLLFVLAAWWFAVRAASVRPAHNPPVICGGRKARAGRRMPFYYDALTMAAAAYMLVAMAFSGAHGSVAAGSLAGPAHHGGAAAGLAFSGPGQDWTTQPALFLAAAFGLAGVVWAVQVFRRLGSRAAGNGGDAVLHLAGAASMALMFAALAA